MKKFELLSPAGTPEKLACAMAYGADAVYLAGAEFGMRAFAGNFGAEELERAFSALKAAGKRAYVAVNTVMDDGDISRLAAYIEYLSERADGVILSDLGALSVVKKHAPGLPVHVSTQASVRNSAAARMWHDLGASRVVLARELSLLQIAGIREGTPPALELEAFVHGAMCVSYSGRCLLSNYMTGRDANRGECAQPCRWSYALCEEKRPGEFYEIYEDNGETFILNAKDLRMIEHLGQMAGAGITSFKIEGRMKSAYYTAAVTGAYRRGLDLLEQGVTPCPKELVRELDKVSHRPYSTGFYLGETEGNEHAASAEYIREYEVCAVADEGGSGRVPLRLKNKLSNGEAAELLMPGRPPVAFVVSGLQDELGAPVQTVKTPNAAFSMDAPCPVPALSFVRRPR